MTRPVGANDFIALNQGEEPQITDTGMGLTFVNELGDYVRYAIDEDRWFVRSNGHWAEDSRKRVRALALTQHVVRVKLEEVGAWDNEGGARDAAFRLVRTYEGMRKKSSILDAAATDPRIQVQVEDFDVVAHELLTESGVVDLDTGELRPSRPEDMHSRMCTARYVPRAESALLDEFLETFLPDEGDQRFVFALLGHALRGGNDRRLFPIFWGPTTSGKSQLFAALHQLLGGYICAIASSVFRGNLDDKPRPDLVNAMFRRIAYATEASKSWALHADQIKRMTGGDVLPYRNLYEGVVNKKPRFTPMLVTNVFPRIVGADWPTKRRIIVVHFDRSLEPGQENPDKKKRFLADPAVTEALLARLVLGARDPIVDNVEWIPQKYVLATMNARGDMDHTDEFLAWMFEEDYLREVGDEVAASTCIRTSEVYSCYTYWLTKFGDDIDRKDRLSLNGFKKALEDKGWKYTRSAGSRWLGRQLGTVPTWMKINIE